MEVSIKRCDKYKTSVDAREIHGQYPFKLYLDIRGNSTIGRQIVIISNKRFLNEDIDEVRVHVPASKTLHQNNNIVRPNSDSQDYQRFKVQKTSILDIKDKILVFELTK